MAKSVTFIDQIAANKRNSNILMLSMVLLLVALGSVFGGFYGDWQTGAFAGVIAAVICLVIALCGGADCLLAFSGAAELHREEVAGVLELQTLFNVVEEMSIAAGVPMPRVFLIDEAAPNAFATGASPENSAVAVTTGLLAKLNREQLQGVIAHEIGHIRNYDIRFSMLMAILAGGIALLSEVFLRSLFFTGGGRRRNEKEGGNMQLLLMVVGLILMIVAPILATLIQLAVSRQREYLADASAVQFTRNPDGLAEALEILSGDRTPMRESRVTENMYIVNPKAALRGGADSLLSTHPPIRERVRRLREEM